MSEQSDAAQSYVDAAEETVSRLPASQPAPNSDQYNITKSSQRFLTKDKTVHQLLGGGRGEVMSCAPKVDLGRVHFDLERVLDVISVILMHNFYTLLPDLHRFR